MRASFATGAPQFLARGAGTLVELLALARSSAACSGAPAGPTVRWTRTGSSQRDEPTSKTVM